MKTLLFMRHGKSSWEASEGGDHERPLAGRGEKAARAVGRALVALGFVPDFVLSSTAVRARTTAGLVVAAMDHRIPARHDRGLYEGGASRVIELVREVPDHAEGVAIETVLVAGHEPTWSDTVSQLIGGGNVRMVTAAVACIASRANRWQDIERGSGELLWLLPPKLLAKLG